MIGPPWDANRLWSFIMFTTSVTKRAISSCELIVIMREVTPLAGLQADPVVQCALSQTGARLLERSEVNPSSRCSSQLTATCVRRCQQVITVSCYVDHLCQVCLWQPWQVKCLRILWLRAQSAVLVYGGQHSLMSSWQVLYRDKIFNEMTHDCNRRTPEQRKSVVYCNSTLPLFSKISNGTTEFLPWNCVYNH